MNWTPARAPLLTRWAEQVTPETAWPEYPRPQLVRPDWLNLNGLWDFGLARREQVDGIDFTGRILVPFPIESALSGVGCSLEARERIWYRRRFDLPPAWHGSRLLLHFGAVDWQASVQVNGREVGVHRGGYLPFSFEITGDVHPGENELCVAVWDPTESHWQARGKQVRRPGGIWYTRVSGIWQTVWLEPVPETYISRLRIVPDLDSSSVRVQAFLDGRDSASCPVKVSLLDGGVPLNQATSAQADHAVDLHIPAARPWSPESPHLYGLVVEAGSDRVESYFGLRKFSLAADGGGRLRLCLNNRPYFQFGPLDQGFWPDGLYTPPSMEAVRWELGTIKDLGCNMLRKHVKVEPARYYYECDRLGLIVWQDMPNGGRSQNEVEAFLSVALRYTQGDEILLGRYGRAAPASRADFRCELQAMVDHLHNFPCIAVWVPFNEGWGQFQSRQICAWLKQYDTTRLVDHASGWYDRGAGDIHSLHVYFKKLPALPQDARRAIALTEYGGYTLKVPGHVWDPGSAFGYLKFHTSRELTEGYLRLLDEQLEGWIAGGLSAAIYTQTTDVETELNGYLTYDRAVEKMDFPRLRAAHASLFEKAGNKEME